MLKYWTLSTLVVILIIINSILAYQLFFPRTVIINDKASTYYLKYSPNNGFSELLTELKGKKSNIKKLKIILSDKSIPDTNKYAPIVPIDIQARRIIKDPSTIGINIRIDPARAKKFKLNELSDVLLSSLIGKLYIISYPNDTIEVRIEEINKLSRKIHDEHSNPFKIIKK